MSKEIDLYKFADLNKEELLKDGYFKIRIDKLVYYCYSIIVLSYDLQTTLNKIHLYKDPECLELFETYIEFECSKEFPKMYYKDECTVIVKGVDKNRESFSLCASDFSGGE